MEEAYGEDTWKRYVCTCTCTTVDREIFALFLICVINFRASNFHHPPKWRKLNAKVFLSRKIRTRDSIAGAPGGIN